MDADEEYLKQFEEIFNCYCKNDESTLNEMQLLELCERLALNKDCIKYIQHLAFSSESPNNCNKLNFSEFCDCFVAALSKFNEDVPSDISSSSNEENISAAPVIKVEPVLIRGGKAYGRRSMPFRYLKEANQMKNESDFESQSDYVIDCDRIGETESIYYEPSFEMHRPEKENYFEAIGMAEATPKKTPKKIQLQKNISLSTLFDDAADVSCSSPFDPDEVDLFSFFLDVGASSIDSEQLIEFWRQGGVENADDILQALDSLHAAESGLASGSQLSATLQQQVLTHLRSQSLSINACMTLALIHSYNFYFRQTNSELYRYRQQVDKMKEEFNRSERHHSKILEEVDERCVGVDQQCDRRVEGIERKYNRKLIAAQRSFDREREALLVQSNSEREELLNEIEMLRSSESLLRRKVNVFSCENKTLSEDAVRMLERLSEAEKDAGRLRKDLECFLAAKHEDGVDPVNTSQEEKFAMIIKDYEAQCRHLSDRNDELASENREFKSQLRQQEIRLNQEDFHRESKMSLKRNLRRRRRKALASGGDSSDASYDDDISDHFHERPGSIPEQSMALNFASIRMRELEQLVEDLRSEKRRALDNFALEKAQLEADLQEEHRVKMSANGGRVRCYDDNRAVEEQWSMTKKLLEETSKERDELEAKYKELKESVGKETSRGEREIANLCRQFAEEKKELEEEHGKQVNSLNDELKSRNQKLEEERQTNERLADQLRFERSEHKEALSAHQEAIDNLEKKTLTRDDDLTNEKLSEIKRHHVEEVEQLKRDHIAELESVKRDTEKRLETLLSEKQIQDNSSVCSELERLQESIGAEREEMHERMRVMREAFDEEASELRQLVNHDKAKLIELLNEEVCLMRQKIAEEGEMELKRRKRSMEEEWVKEKELMTAKRRESEEIINLRSEVDLLQERNSDLERLLSQSRLSLKEEEEKWKRSEQARMSEEALRRRMEDAKRELAIKEVENRNLRKQIDQLIKQEADVRSVTSSLRAQSHEKESERHHLKAENENLVTKVRELEAECRSIRIERAGLVARCERLERSSRAPTPVKRHHVKEKEEMEERMNEMKKEIDDLRSKLDRKDDGTVPIDDVMLEAESATSQSSGGDSAGVMRKRLSRSRQELAQQLGRMKDLYRKLSKSEKLVKDLYCENAHLMKALQVTEARQREAESFRDEEKEKNLVLNRLVRGLCEQIM